MREFDEAGAEAAERVAVTEGVEAVSVDRSGVFL